MRVITPPPQYEISVDALMLPGINGHSTVRWLVHLRDDNHHIKAALELRDELAAYLDAVAPGLVSPVPDGEPTPRADEFRAWDKDPF